MENPLTSVKSGLPPQHTGCQEKRSVMPHQKGGKNHVEELTLPEIVTKTFSPSSTSICWNLLRLMSG